MTGELRLKTNPGPTHGDEIGCVRIAKGSVELWPGFTISCVKTKTTHYNSVKSFRLLVCQFFCLSCIYGTLRGCFCKPGTAFDMVLAENFTSGLPKLFSWRYEFQFEAQWKCETSGPIPRLHDTVVTLCIGSKISITYNYRANSYRRYNSFGHEILDRY